MANEATGRQLGYSPHWGSVTLLFCFLLYMASWLHFTCLLHLSTWVPSTSHSGHVMCSCSCARPWRCLTPRSRTVSACRWRGWESLGRLCVKTMGSCCGSGDEFIVKSACCSSLFHFYWEQIFSYTMYSGYGFPFQLLPVPFHFHTLPVSPQKANSYLRTNDEIK